MFLFKQLARYAASKKRSGVQPSLEAYTTASTRISGDRGSSTSPRGCDFVPWRARTAPEPKGKAETLVILEKGLDNEALQSLLVAQKDAYLESKNYASRVKIRTHDCLVTPSHNAFQAFSETDPDEGKDRVEGVQNTIKADLARPNQTNFKLIMGGLVRQSSPFCHLGDSLKSMTWEHFPLSLVSTDTPIIKPVAIKIPFENARMEDLAATVKGNDIGEMDNWDRPGNDPSVDSEEVDHCEYCEDNKETGYTSEDDSDSFDDIYDFSKVYNLEGKNVAASGYKYIEYSKDDVYRPQILAWIIDIPKPTSPPRRLYRSKGHVSRSPTSSASTSVPTTNEGAYYHWTSQEGRALLEYLTSYLSLAADTDPAFLLAHLLDYSKRVLQDVKFVNPTFVKAAKSLDWSNIKSSLQDVNDPEAMAAKAKLTLFEQGRKPLFPDWVKENAAAWRVVEEDTRRKAIIHMKRLRVAMRPSLKRPSKDASWRPRKYNWVKPDQSPLSIVHSTEATAERSWVEAL